MNSYGYSPHPLSQYLAWVEELLGSAPPDSTKPFLMSVTSSDPSELSQMIDAIQQLRKKLRDDADGAHSRIAIELNTSCPNIGYAPPPSYNPSSMLPLLEAIAQHYWADQTLTIGLKLPPYVFSTQYTDVVRTIASLSREVGGQTCNPIAFLTCTNTLGSSLLFADQVVSAGVATGESGAHEAYALPTPLGGLAGEALHALALGNVYSFSKLLAAHSDAAVRRIAVIGVGGVTSPKAVRRMRAAGARVVACATLLGREGTRAFEILSESG